MNELVTMKRYMYHGDGLKTKQDCIDRLEELQAYYRMDVAEFYYYSKDMGILEYIIMNWDAIHMIDYDSMDIDEREQCAEYWYPPIKHNKKQRQNKYARNRKHKDEMLKKIDNDWYPVWNSGSVYSDDGDRFPKRYYRGKRSKLLKIQSNRKIRRYKGSFQKKGSGFHKVFDFWWELY